MHGPYMTGDWMGASGMFGMLIIGILTIIPLWRLLPKFGIPPWVSILAIFPFVTLILLWVMAFRDKLDGRGRL